MAKKNAVVCDNCNTEALLLELNDDDGDDETNPIGWIHVSSKVTTKIMTEEEDDYKYPEIKKSSGDFCTQACLLEWIQSPDRVWNQLT